MKSSYIRAIAGRLFLGTYRKRVNSNMSPYIVGHRLTFSVLDLANSAYRLQKFLLFLKLTVKNKSMLFCVLNHDALSLAPAISSAKQSFSSKWIGGVLTNYAYCCFYFLRTTLYLSNYEPRLFPGAAIFLNNTKQSVNESIRSRTPGAFLADSSCNVYHTVYGITGNTSVQSFKLLPDLSLAACRQGLRAQKVSFARALYLGLLKNAPKTISCGLIASSIAHPANLWTYDFSSVAFDSNLYFSDDLDKPLGFLIKHPNLNKKATNRIQRLTFFKFLTFVRPVFTKLTYPYPKELIFDSNIINKRIIDYPYNVKLFKKKHKFMRKVKFRETNIKHLKRLPTTDSNRHFSKKLD